VSKKNEKEELKKKTRKELHTTTHKKIQYISSKNRISQREVYKLITEFFEELLEYGFLSVDSNVKKFSRFFHFLFNEETVISYVPIHRDKELKRGFDSAKEIAKKIARATKKEVVCYLKRNVNTKSQKDLKKRERILNIENAFSFVAQKEIKNVVLVNDFWESGSTAKEAARVLKKNGVKRVWVFVLAKTP